MIKLSPLYFLSALIFSLAALTPKANAVSIAVADAAEVMDKSKVSKSVRKQIDESRKAWQAHFDELRDSLKAEGEAIEQNKDVMDEEKYKQEVAKWEEKLGKANQEFRTKQEEIEKLIRTKAEEIDEVLGKTVTKVARQKKVEIVLNTSLVLTHEPSMNITDDILAEFDKAIPDLQLNLPKP